MPFSRCGVCGAGVGGQRDFVRVIDKKTWVSPVSPVPRQRHVGVPDFADFEDTWVSPIWPGFGPWVSPVSDRPVSDTRLRCWVPYRQPDFCDATIIFDIAA